MNDKKVHKYLIIANIIVGFLWMAFCIVANNPLIIPWVGFAGWTSYYIVNTNIKQSLISNIIGVLIGCAIIFLGQFNQGILYNSLVTGLLTGFIIYLMKFKYTNNSAVTFIGGFSAFALNADIKALIISFILGNILGLVTDFIFMELLKRGNK